MKKVGNLSFYDSTGQGEYSFNKPYSEKTAELIDLEVKALVDNEFERAKDIIQKNRKKLEEVAHLLLEKEVIFSEDLERIFGKRKLDSRLVELKPEKKNKTKSNKVDKKVEGEEIIPGSPEVDENSKSAED